MLFPKMKEALEKEFTSIQVSVNENDKVISIPPKNKDVGGIDIQDDVEELTVFVGKFTHWHAGCYEEDYSEQEKADAIVNDVIEFLRDMFKDNIVMWGSHKRSGGCYRKGSKSKINRLFSKFRKEWVWSGPFNS